MTELLVLAGRHLREMTRGRLVRSSIALFVLGIAFSVYLGARSEQADALILLSILVVVALLAAGAALGAGGALPEDRVAGREEWLATLSPPAWKRRVSAALAGWLLAVGLGLAGGAAGGAVLAVVHPDVAPRRSERLEEPPWRADGMAGGQPGPTQRHPAGAGLGQPRRTFEMDVRPRFRSVHVALDRVEVAWETASANGTAIVSVRGPIRIELGPEDEVVRLGLLTEGVTLRYEGARVLGAPTSPILSLALAGLLLGLLVGCVAPVAVFVSRQTTGQTAAAAGCCLLLYGAVKGALLTLAADLDLGGTAAVASAVLRGVGLLAPDAPLLAVFTEAAALRAAAPTVLAAALPALLYGAVALVLVALPAPRRSAEGTNP